MRHTTRKSHESGMALLLAIFTILLLTALGFSLLCAADLETNIAANYRDKQIANYSALSGLQEARDRLIPSRCLNGCDSIGIDTTALAAPATTGGIVYIIQNSSVAPWDPNNAYADTELCKEKIPSFCTADAQGNLTVLPSGSWYTAINDSDSTQGGWYSPASGTALPSPLPYKWVRITLKTDKMMPAPAQSPATNSIMCWDGKYEVALPSGYNANCTAAHALELSYNGTVCPGNVCTFNPPIGSGYANPSPVTFNNTGTGGTGAAATAAVTTLGGGQLTAINVTNGGHDYTAAPTVVISGGSGSGALATAKLALNGAPVKTLSAVTQQSPVGCYSGTPSVSITSTDLVGGGAAATANMTANTCIAKWTLSYSSGTCTQSGTVSVNASGGGGSGFQGSVTLKSNKRGITSYSLTNPGSGYTSVPTLSGLSGCTFTSTFTLGKQVSSLNLTALGSDYDQNPKVTIAGPTAPAGQAPPTAVATIDSLKTGYVSGVTITNGGSGYSSISPPVISFTRALTDTTGTAATATATVNPTSGGAISSISLTSPGSGYTLPPAITIGGGGSGASVQAVIATPTQLGRVYRVTAMATSPGGSKSITQMELATPVVLPFEAPGGLTIDAPSPTISPSNSNNYNIVGTDYNTGSNVAGCSYPHQAAKPSVGVTDSPYSPTNPTAVACLTSVLGGTPSTDPSCTAASGVKPNNYYGAQTSPDVENVYGKLGDLTTPAGCDELATAIEGKAAAANTYYNGPLTCDNASNCGIHLGTYPNDCPPIAVKGDLTIGPGSPTGCGVLLVTGTLTMQGNYTWDGPVFVIGASGSFIAGGGGNGIINGSLFIAQDKDAPGAGSPPCTNPNGCLRSTLGTPNLSFDVLGGGGNGIQYNSCFSDAMLDALNLEFLPSGQPLKILSVRSIF